MKFPDGEKLLEQVSIIGQPLPRIDGALKTTGTAPYAYERHETTQPPLVGYPLGSAIAKGRILAMDTAAAKAAPGVVAVITTLEMKPLPKDDKNIASLFGGPDVVHYHQAIAVVVAETFEQARAGAALIAVEYEADEANFELAKAPAEVVKDEETPEVPVGDFEGAFAAAPVKLDATYTTPPHSHAMMEPHASIAEWQGNRLTLWTANQMIAWTVKALATTFAIPAENIRVESPFIGGGFGAKLFLRADAILAGLAARQLGRPVKVALPRPFIANNTTHRAGTIQRVRIGADNEGRIQAIAHECTSNSQPDGKGENGTQQTRWFYAGDNRLIVNRLAILHLPESNAMRAPGEAAGLLALEIAMDELAEKLDLDPVALRILNDTQVDPEKLDRPFSQRRFVECLRLGAEKFGWADRNPVPAQQREGEWLIGLGVAGAYRGAPAMDSAARVKLLRDGSVVVETDMTDIGTGSYTIIAQTAAEMLGLPVEQIEVKLGSSTFPVSAGSGGQWGAASVTGGVYAACVVLRKLIAQRLGLDPAKATFADGKVTVEDRSVPLTEATVQGSLVGEDTLEFGTFRKEYQLATFAAHFVEVAVHAATGEIRVRRMLAVCDAGRILNPLTARSQVIGGMTMGVGAALMEELAIDKGRGFFVNHDLAGYEVPVHADIPEQEVVFLPGGDPVSSPLKAKGVGELGICGVGAAVANAIYNATGVRVRDYPVTLDKLLRDLPSI